MNGKVLVECTNDACPKGGFSGFRARGGWSGPCPRCSAAVRLAPGQHDGPLEVEPLPGREGLGRVWEGVRRSKVELKEFPKVDVMTLKKLSADPRRRVADVAGEVLDAWAAQQS